MKVLLESGDLAYEAGVSGTYIRDLVRKGIVTPVAVTPRGVRLYEEGAIAIVRKWLEERDARAEERKRERWK